MGYNISIKKHDSKISKEKWLKYVDDDPELKQINEFSAQLPDGRSITTQIPDSALWNNEIPFTYYEDYGEITVKNPDLKIIEKMVSISKKLNAFVAGEEEEIYDEEYIQNEKNKPELNLEDFKNIKIKEFNPNKKWWQFWK